MWEITNTYFLFLRPHSYHSRWGIVLERLKREPVLLGQNDRAKITGKVSLLWNKLLKAELYNGTDWTLTDVDVEMRYRPSINSAAFDSIYQLIRWQRQELRKVRASGHLAEQFCRRCEVPGLKSRAADFFLDARQFLREQFMVELRSYLATIGQRRAVPQPLPDLGARDFRRGRVLHQMVERHAAVATEPGFETR